MKQPQISADAIIMPGAVVLGDAQIASQTSVWYRAVIRADCSKISIGEKTNIQDGAILHSDASHTLTIGDEVTVGHGAILHGCTIANRVLIGMGSIIMDGATIGENCIIAAGSLVTQGTIIPSGTLWMGSPAKQRRTLTATEIEQISESAQEYMHLASLHQD